MPRHSLAPTQLAVRPGCTAAKPSFGCTCPAYPGQQRSSLEWRHASRRMWWWRRCWRGALRETRRSYPRPFARTSLAHPLSGAANESASSWRSYHATAL